MALSGSITNYFQGARSRFHIILDWSASQSIVNNTSTITAKAYVRPEGAIIANATKSGSITIAGNKKDFTFVLGSVGAGVKKYVAEHTVVVSHNTAGDLTAVISSVLAVDITYSDRYLGSISTSGNAVLNNIPRASTITTFNPFTIGNNIAWAVDRKYSAYTHKVELLIGNEVIASMNSASASGTLGVNLAAKNRMLALTPKANSITATLRVTTYTNSNYDVQVGSTQTKTVSASVGAEVVPSFSSISHSEAVDDVKNKFGKYVQNLTKLNVAILGTVAGTGSSIKSYKIEVAGQTANAQSGTTLPINQHGNVRVVGTVVDERNRSHSKYIDIDIQKYEAPGFNSIDIFRAKQNGEIDPFGSFLKISYKATASSLINVTEKNTLKIEIQRRNKGGTWASSGIYIEPTLTPTRTVLLSGFSTITEYEIRFILVDLFEDLSKQTTDSFPVEVGSSPFFVGKKGLASSFGKIPTHGTKYDVEFGIKGFITDGPAIDKNGVEIIGNATVDTRDDNQPPSWYLENYPQLIVREFKQSASIGIAASLSGGTYIELETRIKWKNTSGGNVFQLAYADNGRIFTRTGTGETWNVWETSPRGTLS